MLAPTALAYALPALWLIYTVRALVRKDWRRLPPDTKAFYLLVAPPMSLATDIVIASDRLFYKVRGG